jgi:integrase
MKSTTHYQGPSADLHRVRAVRVIRRGGSEGWTVVDRCGLPVESVDQYLAALEASDYSANSVKSYARHLSLFLRWLDVRGTTCEAISFDDVVDFVADLSSGALPSASAGARGPRKPATVKAVLAAVEGFLEFERLEGRGPVDLRLRREASNRGHGGPGSFLQHLATQRPTYERRIKVGRTPSAAPRGLPEGLDDESLFDACRSDRDRLLLSVLLDGGLRIGQALGLQHGDLDPMRKRLVVRRRSDNPNGALSKQRMEFNVALPTRTFDLYRAYLLGPLADYDIQEDLIFVSLSPQRRGSPMSYSNAYDIVGRLGERLGFRLTPHMFRHEHGTRLARAGWTAPEIAKRLGHSNPSSSDAYIHLTNDDVQRRFDATSAHLWGEGQA